LRGPRQLEAALREALFDAHTGHLAVPSRRVTL